MHRSEDPNRRRFRYVPLRSFGKGMKDAFPNNSNLRRRASGPDFIKPTNQPRQVLSLTTPSVFRFSNNMFPVHSRHLDDTSPRTHTYVNTRANNLPASTRKPSATSREVWSKNPARKRTDSATSRTATFTGAL
ncbi:hypothetical protein ZHAS_00019635 [Anopheles sinensis]|uniref:Uncharacterized protein n=1 Tax=Anopheles sinensis TaxID=74873 RepID=A0A084WMX2_ANOSI|nr:hypothetical protein ZHAS_00019635 [Anopheles sinensis]